MNKEQLIWVEIELEVGESYNNYNCQIALSDYRRIENGFTENPFLKIYNVHWYKLPSGDDDWQGKKLVEYGVGDYSEYSGEGILQISRITSL